MSELTAQEAQELLLDYSFDDTNYHGDPFTYTVEDFRDYWNEEVTEAEFEGVGKFEVVQVKGGEGQGDRATVVFRFVPAGSDSTLYFRVDGYYTSYDGVDFSYSTLREVQLKEKVIKVYE